MNRLGHGGNKGNIRLSLLIAGDQRLNQLQGTVAVCAGVLLQDGTTFGIVIQA